MLRTLAWILLPALLQAGEARGPEASREAAVQWLSIVDAGRYTESWEKASAEFRKAVTREKWSDAVRQARGPLGKFKSRSFLQAQFLKDPPNAPAGEYYLLQFESDFENRAGAVETTVMEHESGKEWRLSGYFVK